MTDYSFKDTINHFGTLLKAEPPAEDIEAGEVELILDEATIQLSKGLTEGSFEMRLDLGVFLGDPNAKHLATLASANFLGVDTGGCSLCLDDDGSLLFLKVVTSPGTTPQENWDWLHRIVSIAHQWYEEIASWEEISPLVDFKQATTRERPPQGPIFKV